MIRRVLALLLAGSFAAMAAQAEVALDVAVGGRVLTKSENGAVSYTYAWPGVYFEARFTGEAVSVRIDDAENNLYLYVDGVHKLTLTRPGRTTVALKELGPGPHVVRLEKASESQTGTGRFEGFSVADPADRLPAPVYAHRIEFIGDSFTVGYGNTSRGHACTPADVRDTTDTAQSFAPMAAKHFNAAYRINAFSGRGVVRNYGGMLPGLTLPVLYGYTLFDGSAAAADAGWTPEVVVAGLGTNDFSTPLAENEPWKTRQALRADFVRGYTAFLQGLHAKWPKAHFILMASQDFDAEILDGANETADALKAAGMEDVEVLPFDGLDYMACDGHPSLKDDLVLSQILIGRLAQLPGFAPPAP
jgi:hypothetical protein